MVGWSFGGAPAFTVGEDDRIVGCATVASQTAETEGIENVGRKGVPLLLLHGTGDRTPSPRFSHNLYHAYGHAMREDKREIKFFEGDDHALTRNSLEAEELLCEFITRCASVGIGHDEHINVIQKQLVDEEDRIEKMKQDGDLRGKENVEQI